MAIPVSPDVPASDYSGQIIDSIFGTGWENLLAANSIGGAVAQNMVFPIIGAFNTIALFAVAMFLLLLFSQGIIGTAHEGTAMGKRFHNIWLPVRGAFSVVLLTPIIGGMSLFQIGILACIGWSINFGNYVWNIGVTTFVNHGGILTTSAPSGLQEDTQILAKQILRTQTYQSYFRDWQNDSLPNGNVYTSVWDDTKKEYVLTFNSPADSNIPPGSFGKIFIKCPQGENDIFCIDKHNAVNQLIQETLAIADDLSKPEQSASFGALITAIDTYNNSIVTASQARFATLPDMTAQLNAFKQTAQSGGWLTAAPYYWSISSMNQKRRNLISAQTTMQPSAIDTIKNQAYTDINNVEGKYEDFIKSEFLANSPATLNSGGDGNVVLGALRKLTGWLFAEKIYTELVNNLATDDPVITLTNHGHTIITGSQTMFVGLLALTSSTFFAKGVKDSWLGKLASSVTTFGTAGGAVESLSAVVKSIIIPIILMLCIGLYVYGFTLAYYLPAIPMIYFLSAAISWIILVLEAIVAAPLWVASHAMAEGEGPIGHNAKQGYFLMLSILMRPALIVTGFLFSLIIITAFGKIVNFAFTALGLNLADKYLFGPSSMVAMSVILCVSLLIFCQKIFILIVKLPTEVTRWVGQYFHNLGEDQDESRASQGFGSMGRRSESAITSSGGAVENVINKNKKISTGNTEGDHATKQR